MTIGRMPKRCKRINQLKEKNRKYQSYHDQLAKSNTNSFTTDPDARLMVNNNNSVEVSYNVQTSVDARHKLIVDFKVTGKPNDLGQLAPMALRTKDTG